MGIKISTCKKWLLACAAVLLFINLAGVTLKLSYRYRVNTSVAVTVKRDLVSSQLTSEVIKQSYDGVREDSIAQWGEVLVRSINKPIEKALSGGGTLITPNFFVEVSKDGGKNWLPLLQSEELTCEFGAVYNARLYCLAFPHGEQIELRVLELNGVAKKKILGKADINEVEMVYRKSDELWIVWRDKRAQFPNLYAFIPIPHSHSVAFGPSLRMAGKLDLNTMNFKEYVIQYDSKDVDLEH